MKKITRIKKIFILCVIMNVVVFGVYTFLFLDIKAKNEKVYDLLSEADRDIKKDETLRAVKYSLSENKNFISQIDSFFVPQDGVVSFIDTLERLELNSGIDLGISYVSVETNTKNKNDFKEVLNLRLDGEGSWQNLFHFLSLLENLPYRIEFNSVSFVLSGASDSILFSGSDGLRVRAPSEFWKGSFEVLVYKLK